MTTSLTPPRDLLDRFAADLDALAPQGTRLGIAVSGGPDSLALLLLAAAARPGMVEAATVDHGLRREAKQEARFVASVCRNLAIPHHILHAKVAPGASLQAQARTARYRVLGAWAIERDLGAVASAHHADDQAETLLMRLARGAGLSGLSATRRRRVLEPGVLLVRPLLDWRRAELGEIVAAAQLTPVDDPSNRDPRFDRARLRQALAQADWIDPAAVAQSAAHLADADAALEWAARREFAESVTRDGPGLTYRPRAPRAIALRVLAMIVREMDHAEPRGSALARLFDALARRETASIGNLVARPLPGGWSFTPAPRRRSDRPPV